MQPNRGPHRPQFIVGTVVVLAPHDVRGIVIDLVLDEHLVDILYAVVAFDTGVGGSVLYQPIRWNLLRRSQGQFVVNATADAIETGISEGLAAALSYGGNVRRSETFVPTPQSVRVH